MKIETMQQSHDFLSQFIPQGVKQVFAEDLGLKRAKQLLVFLDNPQNKLKVIHVAGTSGKGSTVQIISSLLIAQGFHVGLCVSPHLIDLRERFQINNTLISEKEFATYLTDIIPAIEKMKHTPFKKPTFFEITMALAFYIFWKKKVDYAVVETGLGGLFDGTNVVERKDKVAVITKIGHDHTHILGKTLPKIAYQKAGIIQPGNICIVIEQKPRVEVVFQKIAKEKNASLRFVRTTKEIRHIQQGDHTISFDFISQNLSWKGITLGLDGFYQAENAGLALAVLSYLSQRDTFPIREENARRALKHIVIPGRFQTFRKNGVEIIIDGAHNPQKMEAFINSLQQKYQNKKLHFLIAFKQAKDYKKMLKIILPVAKSIVLTDFSHAKQGFHIASVSPQEIAKQLEMWQFSNHQISSKPVSVLREYSSSDTPLVVTGSLYLVGDVLSYLNS